MLDQNMSEANLDFTYYNNPNDEFRANTGSLLPLWNIGCRLVRGMLVTDLCWNTLYPDLFAVAYKDPEKDEADEKGEDDLGIIFEKGCVCVYSLKGPSHPERIYVCPSAVRCLDFHPDRPYLVAMGFFGGTVAVYDLRREDFSPSGKNSNSEKLFHQDTVSEIQWLPDTIPQKFCSVSADGKIIKWQFMLHDLFPSEVVTSLLVRNILPEAPPKGIEMEKETVMEEVSLKAGGTALSITGDSFAVGTTTGAIVLGSLEEKVGTADHVDHKHSVRSVQWNPYHPDVLLSCGKDFTVRIWHRSIRSSVFKFFFEQEVVDVRWAPFSSTLFAAISGNAVIHVFDLSTSKTEAVGTYTVYTAKQNSRLTVLRFHLFKPILMVGDDR
ncbi:dynein axonemal intermediate chain 1-like [Uloborus diversus]|uniref:dynein axonemal intermediate chain 1-like n=1 Tax=Uloborus diversus TaxID=327109 RepID=UPI002409FE07|nr:dynein axonemal intermediate chain 1-like [Uloborus diversus]